MILYTFISIAIILLDQITKIFALHLKGSAGRELIHGVLSLVYVENRGAAFGMLQGARIFFIVITAIVFIGGFVYFKKNPLKNALSKTAVAFVAGGALGNFIDRVFLGYVRDFICTDFISFPVVNIADCFVCVGAALFVLCIFTENRVQRHG